MKVKQGFIIANLGRLNSVGKPLLSRVSSLVSTEELLVSLPAAAIVSMHPIGRLFSKVFVLVQNSHISVSGLAAPCAIALAVSIALPPPIPSIKSALKSIAFFTPSLACDRVGLATAPPNN